MRKVLLGLVITGFALVLFITIKPQTSNLALNPESPATDPSEEQITFEAIPYFSAVQGETVAAFLITNNMPEAVNYSLGHEHAYLTFRPQGDSLPPGSSREVLVQVDPRCPVGEVDLPVYLRAAVNGERVGKDAVVSFNVLPGRLSMEQDRYGLIVLWNDEPAPRGAAVYYRKPGETEWQLWGETPGINPPDHLEPGDYDFEFMAELGDVATSVEAFTVTVEEPYVREVPEPETEVASSSGSGSSTQVKEPEPEPEPEPKVKRPEVPKPGTREYNYYMLYRKQGETPEQFIDRVYEMMLEEADEESKPSGPWYDFDTKSKPGWF